MEKTAFHSFHLQHDGQMVDFAGWEMPIRYGSIIEEHKMVREGLGMFDISHMGRVYISGRHARKFLETILTRRISDMKVESCRYSLVCNEQGGVLDDIICYRFDEKWLLVVNASNREKLLKHFEEVKAANDFKVSIDDQTKKTAMIACQGPNAMEYISKFSSKVPLLKRYSFAVKNLMLFKLIISRTGYTGEDGVEIILPASMVGMAMKLLIKEDGDNPLKPAGLGARDSLRLEAGMPLYGHELSEALDPYSAGLDFAVSIDKDQATDFGGGLPFIGQEALKKIKAEGPKVKLIGLKLDGKRTPRQDMAVLKGEEKIGTVTSGCLSPTLGYPIAMAYVPAEEAVVGNKLAIDFGRKTEEAEIVPLPFYKASK